MVPSVPRVVVPLGFLIAVVLASCVILGRWLVFISAVPLPASRLFKLVSDVEIIYDYRSRAHGLGSELLRLLEVLFPSAPKSTIGAEEFRSLEESLSFLRVRKFAALLSRALAHRKLTTPHLINQSVHLMGREQR
jgi:hypothetical protein